MNEHLTDLIRYAGVGQLCVLVASVLVPIRLSWITILAELPPLMRQLFWVYGGYVVLSIISLGTISILAAEELASGGLLARAFCTYVATYWGVRLCLQPVLKVKSHLTTWWLVTGYHGLTVLFVSFTLIFGFAALHS